MLNPFVWYTLFALRLVPLRVRVSCRPGEGFVWGLLVGSVSGAVFAALVFVLLIFLFW